MKRIVILGAGESGVGAALLAKQRGFDVFVSDKSVINDVYKAELDRANIAYESGFHTEERILNAHQIVKSPGIPDKIALIQAAILRGVPVISEIEFAYQNIDFSVQNPPFIIGITGSNGKTTTTSLAFHALKTAGLDVAVGGNIGKSFARLLVEEPLHRYYVLELSSFQLDGIATFKPNIAIILNITPDHLDRYDYKLDNYIASKFRITMNQNAADFLIFNQNDVNIAAFIEKNTLKAIPLAISYRLSKWVMTEKFDTINSRLQGPHNEFNASCVVAISVILNISSSCIQESINTFQPPPHRLEFVKNIKKTDYINDSKATNVDSVFWALSAMTKPVILIIGGLDKGNDYTQIEALVSEKVKVIVALGVDNHKIMDFFTPLVKNIEETHAMSEAVAVAVKYTEGGDVVLLSPACASFDLFKNYEDRGDQFKKEVLKKK